VKHGHDATRTQHDSASGLLCAPATGDSGRRYTHSGSSGLHDLSQTNVFIAGV